MVGQTLSHYEITAKLGAGGMGEVYRAEDTRLKREVALKILPEKLAGSQERLERFQREAEILASLDHPHIVTIYSVEEADGVRFLTMQLVEGQSLDELIPKGGLPIERALQIGASLADAFAAAHDKGIVHRDLKPSNVMVNEQGQVKVLDFGLARALATSPKSGDLTHSPTLTYSPTEAGVILGTAPYMSPEQARGEPVEEQADIWALGCVLYEMLAGERAFRGNTTSDVLAAILAREPDWEALPDETPGLARRLLRRCLAQDTRQRLHDMADVRLELEDCLREAKPAVGEAPMPAGGTSRHRRAWWVLASTMVVAAVGLAAWLMSRPEAPSGQVQVLEIRPPTGARFSFPGYSPPIALSRDGQWVAFVGETIASPGSYQIYLRSLRELEARAVPGTEGASGPFFSPDGLWLGYLAKDGLRRVRITGGPSELICRVDMMLGASWEADGTILFTGKMLDQTDSLFEVPAEGGTPRVVATPPAEGAARSFRWAQRLPGHRATLINVMNGVRHSAHEIAVLSLDEGDRRTLLTGGTFPRLLPSGHLIYARLGTIYALKFDVERLEVFGDPVPILENVAIWYVSGATGLAVSSSGALAYLRREPWRDAHPVWVDEGGNVASEIRHDSERFIWEPQLSPDGSRIVAHVWTDGEESDLWIYDLERANWSRLTDQPGRESGAIWSPDGRWVYYAYENEKTGVSNLARIRSDGSAAPEWLTVGGRESEYPSSVSQDNAFLIFDRQLDTGHYDILRLPLEEENAKAEPVLATSHTERAATLSPDGRWMAYQANETGRYEVYVRPYPGPGAGIKLSTSGGRGPRWHPNGNRLFYKNGRDLWSVTLETEPELRAGRPQVLMTLDWDITEPFDVQVSEGKPRFLMSRAVGTEEPLRLVYVSHWQDEVERLVASAQ